MINHWPIQQFQIQDFDMRSSVVAQLRPLTQLSATIKDNAKMLAYELTLRLAPTNPVQGEFVRAASPHGDGGGTPPSQYLGGLGGQPPDPGSHEAIDPKFGIAVADSFAVTNRFDSA
jgi:hypothetical protein